MTKFLVACYFGGWFSAAVNRLPHLLALIVAFESSSLAGPADQRAVPKDKNGWNLFRPVPANLLREMSTDRPDRTESPFTVDAGHCQLEMDFANYTADHDHGAHHSAWNIAPVNFKFGLLHNVDVQVVFESYLREKAGGRTQSGVGDLGARLKINLWGNDGGRTAFAVMPFVSLPTSSADLGSESVEGGVIFPLSVALPGDWGMGVMTEVDFLRDEQGSGYHAEFINSITFSHDLAGNLGGYVEYFSAMSAEDGSPWICTVDVGLTYRLTANVQLDAGCNFGVSRSADDFNPFVGLSVRF